MLIHAIEVLQKTKQDPLSISQKNSIRNGRRTELRLDMEQVSVALDCITVREIFRICVSVNMDIYAIEMTKLEVGGNLVASQRGSSQLFSEKNVITKDEVEQ